MLYHCFLESNFKYYKYKHCLSKEFEDKAHLVNKIELGGTIEKNKHSYIHIFDIAAYNTDGRRNLG